MPTSLRRGSVPDAGFTGSGVEPEAVSGAGDAGPSGACPTSSSNVTPKILLRAISLSSSGTEASVSHLEIDCRETSGRSARSAWDRPRSRRRR